MKPNTNCSKQKAVWEQEEVELQYMIFGKSNKGQNEKKS